MCLRGSKKVTVSALSRQIPAPLFSDAPEVIHETKKDEKKKYSEIYGNFHNVHTHIGNVIKFMVTEMFYPHTKNFPKISLIWQFSWAHQ